MSDHWPYSGWQWYENSVQMPGNHRAAGTHTGLQSTVFHKGGQMNPNISPSACLLRIESLQWRLWSYYFSSSFAKSVAVALSLEYYYPTLSDLYTNFDYCLAITIFQWRQWMLTVNVVLSESEVRLSSLLVDCRLCHFFILSRGSKRNEGSVA